MRRCSGIGSYGEMVYVGPLFSCCANLSEFLKMNIYKKMRQLFMYIFSTCVKNL